MKDVDAPTTTSSTTAAAAAARPRRESSHTSLFGRVRYKFWALAAILLLAFLSIFTGTVTLKWSSVGHLSRISDDLDSPIHDDLDVLEMEEREKVVRHMWDVYVHSSRVRIPRFWQEAFEAAYEYLVTDVPGVRDAAVSEIAKMSMRSIDLQPPPVQSKSTRETRESPKQVEEGKKEAESTLGTGRKRKG